MHPSLRQFSAVILSALVLWFTLRPMYFFLLPWWAFALLMGVMYLVVDVVLEVLYRKVTTR